MKKTAPTKGLSEGLLITGIILVSFCLRPSITSVGPLIPMIREDLGLSNAWAGFLTTLPLLSFATFSLFSSAIGARLGNVRAILLGLFLIAFGIYIRVQGGAFLLYFGTAVSGIGIVICNVLLIPLIKVKLPHKIGIMTSSYTTGMSAFAAVGTGLSVPLAVGMGLGWRGSLLAWVALVALAIVIWLPQVKPNKVKGPDEGLTGGKNVWKSKLAWQVSIFMGIQSTMFYTLIAWLPDLLINKGFSAGQAGLMMSLMQVVGLIGSFTAPLVAVKYATQVKISFGMGMIYFIGFIGLFFDHSWVIYIALTLIGFCLGASISLAYTLIGLRTEGPTTARLSGMAQSAGYYLAALGPLLIGALFDLFANYNLLIILMVICALSFAWLGTKVGRNVKV
ncbi:CynX/NimT family MFS transporter [Echinicola vietnamensis]|uniref:Cyanate permease n=1 Tax=Echinicola vietnamensis (strain DSM 17526 / LMG 23754 / KMM 6221) TaxID=926556 RepID=L0FSM5_ECHVK|nr:MFS transporter [Echinicola vietnamensis]AGA76924.1 cyanate permease [Echinicola vietnamensis DSM 17526]